MKFASVLMTIVFAGVLAQATETAPAAPAHGTETAAPADAKKADKKAKKTHAKGGATAPAETTAPATTTPSGH